MTDQERFAEWWKDFGWPDYEGYHTAKDAFLAALAIGREEGRKERTVEIANFMTDFIRTEGYPYNADIAIYEIYPECFGEGDG